MQKWEYLWRYFYEADSKNVNTSWKGKEYKGYQQCDQALNDIGELGWELVGITSSFKETGSWMQVQMLFKRPKG